MFTEVVVAPSFDDDALDVLLAKKNLRVLSAPPPGDDRWQLRSIDGGRKIADVLSSHGGAWISEVLASNDGMNLMA